MVAFSIKNSYIKSLICKRIHHFRPFWKKKAFFKISFTLELFCFMFSFSLLFIKEGQSIDFSTNKKRNQNLLNLWVPVILHHHHSHHHIRLYTSHYWANTSQNERVQAVVLQHLRKLNIFSARYRCTTATAKPHCRAITMKPQLVKYMNHFMWFNSTGGPV